MNKETDTQTRTWPDRLPFWLALFTLLVVVLALAFPVVRQTRSVAWVEAQGGRVDFEDGWLSSRLPATAHDWLAGKDRLLVIQTIPYVGLSGTNVDDAGLVHLKGMTSLKGLALSARTGPGRIPRRAPLVTVAPGLAS